eukprot:1158025-Pelagomonas_calceolata.AAC.1
MECVHGLESQSPAWLCIVKPAPSAPPWLLREFQDVEADPALPEKRAVGHAIDVFPGSYYSAPQMGPNLRLAPSDLEELPKQLD